VPLAPLPPDPRTTARSLSRAVVEGVLSDAKVDIAKAAGVAIVDHDRQTLAHYVARQAREELVQHAAGALMQALPEAFAYWSERLADLQSEHADLVDEHGALLCVDELNARRADRYDVFAAAESLRQEHDAIRAGFLAARQTTDNDATSRFKPEAQYRFSDGAAILNTDVSGAVRDVFASTDPMTAASSLGWVCWAPSPSEQARAVQQRLSRADLAS
jgi:hypothetical protein